mmetsp:Transcript_6346/g.14556  ORF Transcript_6346/g.14556 Transcript_6346/m.14556 type:complete len:1172 (+) Transcript_6346:18-3533(+)
MLRQWTRIGKAPPVRRQHVRARRCQVSTATLVQRVDNILPCYTVVQHQMRPRIEEQPGRCEQTSHFTHSIKWVCNEKEYAFQGTHRSKRGAKNEAARQLLQCLAEEQAPELDPRQNGAIAQWAIGSISEVLDGTLEIKEEPHEGDLTGQQSHICTWSCPQIEGEITATGSAAAATQSRREAFAALYRSLPENLEELYLEAAVRSKNHDQAPQQMQAKSNNRARFGEINAMHNTAIQKLNIQAAWDFQRQPSGKIECTLTWTFYDYATSEVRKETVSVVEHSKAAAKAMANQKMLTDQGHMLAIPDSQQEAMDDIQQALKEQRVKDAVEKAMALMEETPEIASWSFFLPHVFRAVLGEGDVNSMHEVLACALRLSEKSGMPVELWEALLDEASFSVRHYFMATPALRQLGGFPLADAFPGPLEKEYFNRFRHLLALERHGSLMHGIQQYELEPDAQCSVPTLEVHQHEASLVVLTSTPTTDMTGVVEGSRSLKPSDLVLLVPSEAAEEVQIDESEIGNSTNWQHPEAWLASVVSILGNPQFGEEVKVQVRRISDFASDVKGTDTDAGQPRASPITIGRHFRLYFLAMETPMSRQLAALRSLTQIKLPVWSDNFEGLKRSYQYSDAVSEVILAGPDDARQLAQETARGGLSRELSLQNLEKLSADQPLVASLTPSQREAVTKSLEQRLSLIQGPPGTGKTHVACAILAVWATIFGPLGERILAVADSNVAADNLFARLGKMGIHAVRVGQGKDHEYDISAMVRQLQSATVVVATCIGSGTDIVSSKTAGGAFQRVLVDECTQACEPAVLVALGRRSEQVVLIGDHAQLPATVLSKTASHEGLSTSLFERMASQNSIEPTVLLEQRRMHSSIADFPNATFYGGQLVNAADDAQLTAVPGFPWPNQDCRVCFVDVSQGPSMLEGRRGFSAFNTAEAETLVDVLNSIITAGYPEEQVVVLTAYLAQKQEILRVLRDRGLGHLKRVTVDTVDGYQGMEQGLVLFSATRSNESRALGFLADARRMNVMLTRAKQGLIVFGNADTLRLSEAMNSKWPNWLSWAEARNATVSADQLSRRIAEVQETPQEEISKAFKQEHQGPGPESHTTPFPEDYADAKRESLNMAERGETMASGPSAASPAPDTAWQQVYSEEYRAHYYWNTESNVTQWEQPQQFKPAV